MVNWQPIETAPKDGTKVALWYPGEGAYSPCFWSEEQHSKKPRPYWGGMYAYLFGKTMARTKQPTHWAPITPPEV